MVQVAEAYIVESDVKNRSVKPFFLSIPLEMADYLDDANEWFEEYIPTIIDDDQYGVSDVTLPVKKDVKNFILNYMYMQFAQDNIGAEGTPTVNENNLYESIYAHAKDRFAELKPRITQNIILKTNTDRTSSAVNWGSIARS